MIGSVLLNVMDMKQKSKQKPPKFYVSVALKDIVKNIPPYDAEDVCRIVLSRLKRLSETLSCNQLAPMPKELEGSWCDPKMLELRSDEEFKDFYSENLRCTSEECIAIAIYAILIYDIEYHKKCHIYGKDTNHQLDFTTGSIKTICADMQSNCI